MQRLVIIVLIIGLVGFIIHKNTRPDPTTPVAQTPTPAQQEHAALTKMALESEAKAKQAATLANQDTAAMDKALADSQ